MRVNSGSRSCLPLMLEQCQPSIVLSGLNHTDVVGGRLPSESFVDELRALVGAAALQRRISPAVPALQS
jgi:hypothetical protein